MCRRLLLFFAFGIDCEMAFVLNPLKMKAKVVMKLSESPSRHFRHPTHLIVLISHVLLMHVPIDEGICNENLVDIFFQEIDLNGVISSAFLTLSDCQLLSFD